MASVNAAESTSVYMYFGEDGNLIYVGVTSRGKTRQHEHARDKAWWPLVAKCEIKHYHSRESALAQEKYLIHYHQPPFNTVHRTLPGRRKAVEVPRSMRLPIQTVRSILGRTARAATVAEIDIEFLCCVDPHCRTQVTAAYRAALHNGETVADLRARLKSLADPL